MDMEANRIEFFGTQASAVIVNLEVRADRRHKKEGLCILRAVKSINEG